MGELEEHGRARGTWESKGNMGELVEHGRARGT